VMWRAFQRHKCGTGRSPCERAQIAWPDAV
jgi:hypothetical protein